LLRYQYFVGPKIFGLSIKILSISFFSTQEKFANWSKNPVSIKNYFNIQKKENKLCQPIHQPSSHAKNIQQEVSEHAKKEHHYIRKLSST
jgi:hypothetical protein